MQARCARSHCGGVVDVAKATRRRRRISQARFFLIEEISLLFMNGRSFEKVGWELHTRMRKKQAGYVKEARNEREISK
jgi:hypothetical protein